MNQNYPAESTFPERIREIFFIPTDISFLVFFRLLFGGIMLWEVCRYFLKGWIYRYYVEPQIYFSYYGFDWVKPLSGDLMYVVFLILGASCVGIILGFYYRLSAIIFFVTFTYIFLLDQTQYLNHFYLIILLSFLLIFLPAEKSFSVDAWRKPEIARKNTASWNLYLLRFQIAVVYIFGGIAKINADWLQGEPMRMWLAQKAEFEVLKRYLTEDLAVCFFALGGLYFDLLVVPFLLWKRTRNLALIIAVCFHLLNFRLFNIGIFPWMMIGATLIFLPPEVFAKLLGLAKNGLRKILAFRKKGDSGQSSIVDFLPPSAMVCRVNLVLLVAYALFQATFPLRHFLYPGNVSWTEEGHKFSWHMKLRDKKGEAVFYVSSPANGKLWRIYPSAHLTPRQSRKMVTQPEMILQYSHFLASEKAKEGYKDVEVRAHVAVSLNGRKPQLLVDPSVNLAAKRPTISAATWIMPMSYNLK